MLGTKIIAEENPKGKFLACRVHGTPKPGTVMMVIDEAPVAGIFHWGVYDVSADGVASVVAVLLEKEQEGKTYDDAYVDGDQGMLYFPLPGEFLNMLIQNPSGTADDHDIGDILMIDDGTGTLIADSSGARKPFVMMEDVGGYLTADTHKLCMFTGV